MTQHSGEVTGRLLMLRIAFFFTIIIARRGWYTFYYDHIIPSAHLGESKQERKRLTGEAGAAMQTTDSHTRSGIISKNVPPLGCWTSSQERREDLFCRGI